MREKEFCILINLQRRKHTYLYSSVRAKKEIKLESNRRLKREGKEPTPRPFLADIPLDLLQRQLDCPRDAKKGHRINKHASEGAIDQGKSHIWEHIAFSIMLVFCETSGVLL